MITQHQSLYFGYFSQYYSQNCLKYLLYISIAGLTEFIPRLSIHYFIKEFILVNKYILDVLQYITLVQLCIIYKNEKKSLRIKYLFTYSKKCPRTV